MEFSGVTKRLQNLENEVTEFITPPRKRSHGSQKRRYEQQPSKEIEVADTCSLTSPPGGKGLPRQECIDLVIATQPTTEVKREHSPEEIEVELEDDIIEDDRCSGSTRELNDDIDEVSSPTCFVTQYGQTEVHHFEASDPIDDVGDSL